MEVVEVDLIEHVLAAVRSLVVVPESEIYNWIGF